MNPSNPNTVRSTSAGSLPTWLPAAGMGPEGLHAPPPASNSDNPSYPGTNPFSSKRRPVILRRRHLVVGRPVILGQQIALLVCVGGPAAMVGR